MENKTYGILRNHVPEQGHPAFLSRIIWKTLQKHLSPEPLLIAERFHFHKRNQLKSETVRDYSPELRKL